MRSTMESIPREIALNILSRLPIASLLRSKCVCKAWYSLAKDPRLPLIHQQASKNNDPCLILHCDSALPNHLYLIDTHHETLTNTWKLDLPFESVMPNFEISGSCNGFLCLSDLQTPGSSTIYIYNPLTHESIQLPPPNINFSNQKVVMGFGFHPATKEYKVIRTVYCIPPRTMLGLGYFGYGRSDTSTYTIGTDSWRSLGEPDHWLDGRSPTALVNGALHWLTQWHKYKQFQDIVSFDLATEKFDKVSGPSCESFKNNWNSLVELGGCLGAVVRTSYYGGFEVWVMKDYKVEESWTKELVIRAYSPVGFNLDIELSERMRAKGFWKNPVRVVCGLRTGEILLEYGNQALVCYDPLKGVFKDLHFDGLSNCFELVALMGSLLSLQGGFGMEK